MRNVPRLQPKEDRQGCGDDAALTVVELAAATDGIESADREHARSSSEVLREQVGLLIFDFGRMLCYRVNKPGGYKLLDLRVAPFCLAWEFKASAIGFGIHT